jgi:hypothetical protein
MRSVVASGLLLLVVGIFRVDAQERIVVQGVVQWVAGTQMVMYADTGVSVRVDLTRATRRPAAAAACGGRSDRGGRDSRARTHRLLAESITSGAGTIPTGFVADVSQSP